MPYDKPAQCDTPVMHGRPMLYDRIGAGFEKVRPADERLTAALAARLPAGTRIADVGCGTGKYARALAQRGYRVVACEASAVMLSQAAPERGVSYARMSASRLALRDGAVGGAISVLAVHHFPDAAAVLREIDRVTDSGTVVLVVGDARLGEPTWFRDYFPAVHEVHLRVMPPLERVVAGVARELGRDVRVDALPIPRDYKDLFCSAAWSRPELYLDEAHRACSSSFARVPAETVLAGVRALARDLRSGAFARRFAPLAERSEVDLGLRVLTVDGR